jgi:hypothetical protein
MVASAMKVAGDDHDRQGWWWSDLEKLTGGGGFMWRGRRSHISAGMEKRS